MLVRLVAATLGVLNAANGLCMIVAPNAWFAHAATATGPFNGHFVTDVGFAFLAGGAAFLAFAWRPAFKLAALGASGFLVLHALFHIAGLFHNHHADAGAAAAIALPAFLGLAIAWPRARGT
jgi:hypothetical protein